MNKAAKPNRDFQFFLAGLCMVFVLFIFLDMNTDYELTAVDGSTSQDMDNNGQATTAFVSAPVKAIGEYDHIIERPLFMDDRRPYVPEETIAGPHKSQRKRSAARKAQDDFMLSAVIITDSKRIALLQSNNYKKLQKLHQGDELDGWILTDVQSAHVSLTKGSEIKRLELTVKGSPKQADPLLIRATKKPDRTELNPAAAMIKKNSPGPETVVNIKNSPEYPAN